MSNQIDTGMKLVKLDIPVTGPGVLWIGFDPETGQMVGAFDKDGTCIGRPE